MEPVPRLITVVLALGIMFSGLIFGDSTSRRALLPTLNPSSELHQATDLRPVLFRNYMDGFEFEVPPGWVVSTFCKPRSIEVSVDRPIPGLEDGFRLKRCPGPTPEDCMGDDGMLANLVNVTAIQMAGYPAKEFRYDRQTVSRTRLWKEIISVLHVRDRTYGLIVQIPHHGVEREYLALYRQIRDSFRLINP